MRSRVHIATGYGRIFVSYLSEQNEWKKKRKKQSNEKFMNKIDMDHMRI